MKAMILNSGVGKRMGPLTQHKPKCLLKVRGDETILSRQVKSLLDNEIHDIIITTGPFAGELQRYLDITFKGVSFNFVPNPLYDSTNYIYSMLLAKNLIDEDIILMHGDLVFDNILLKRTVLSDNENTVLVNPYSNIPNKDFKARVENGRVLEISVNIFDSDCFFLIPLYKLSLELCQNWFSEIDKFKKEGKLQAYAEDALNNILFDNPLYPLYFSQELCSEVDNLEDLERVQGYFS